MGLREINAARTRQLIVDGALELFVERGYDATTMEDIAGHVGIGISTLYRYFPSKDLLATAPIGEPGLMATELLARPEDETPEQALAHALIRLMENAGENPRQAEDFQRLVEGTPRLGLRVIEWLVEAHQQLAEALAVRRGLPVDDLSSAASAWLAVFVLQRVDQARQAGDTRSGTEIAADLMTQLGEATPVTPRL
jgi:AcrR family transcriptional regulator